MKRIVAWVKAFMNIEVDRIKVKLYKFIWGDGLKFKTRLKWKATKNMQLPDIASKYLNKRTMTYDEYGEWLFK